jgi:hypothetical protein
MTIFRSPIITTLQPPEEKQIIPVYNGVGTQSNTKELTIKQGTGTYKLHKPNGRKEGIISWSQYGQNQLIDKFKNLTDFLLK